jgi:LysM repeat protein
LVGTRPRRRINVSLTPVAIASAIAITLGGPSPMAASTVPAKRLQNPPTERPLLAAPAAVRTAEIAPAQYTVVSGDTVSGLAERFGLKTVDILALNGLD